MQIFVVCIGISGMIVMVEKQSFPIGHTGTSNSKSTQLEYAVLASKIGDLNSGEHT